jgi:serine/threonine-protein kinase
VPARQEDFVFAERVLQHGYATEEQVQECLSLLDRLRGEMQIDESLANLMVKKGYLAPAQANVLDAEIDPSRAGRPRNAIEGYRLLERIGSGAMGSVYKAHHLKLDIAVALKVLRPSLASSRTQIERLKREAQLAARLNHPNVVRSLDVGESNGFHYLVMEFVEGKTVRDLIQKGPLPEKEALAIVRQVASGLAHAHANGVVHRDVKPGNIMITREGTAKLADFGLARGQQPSDLTLEHASIGTPQYVAPEQMRRGSDATPRSDLFSLGSTLYHMVTGRPPFDGESLGEIVQNVLVCRFPPPESVAKGLSRDTIYVIGRLMRSNPRERYASAAELVADLERMGQGGPVAPADFLGDYQAFLRKRRGRRNAVFAVGAAVLVCAGVLYRQHRIAERERTEFEARCLAARDTGVDVVVAKTLDALGGAITAMERAEQGARECDPAAIEPLRKRLRLSRDASDALAAAEKAAAGASAEGADYCKLDADLAGLPGRLAGVEERIAAIRDEIRGRSEEAATARYHSLEFRDLAEVAQEARAFAKDLKDRYLASEAPWRADVAQAPRFLDTFDEEWSRLDGERRGFEEAIEKGEYSLAADRLAQLKADEDKARNALLRNPYLARFSGLFPVRDERAKRLKEAETTEWGRILAAATAQMQATPRRPDRAEKDLTDFLRRAKATHGEAQQQLDKAAGQRRDLEQQQLESYARDEALFRNRLRERAYTRAYEDVASVSASEKWLALPAEKYRALAERAAAIAELPRRFLDGARGQKTVTIRKGVQVAGKDIEAAPGDDLFAARRGRERIEFTLVDLDLKDLERIFAFEAGVARDRTLSGSFHAAEAFRADDNPYEAEKLRRQAQIELSKDDPWMADLEVALAATTERIKVGEERAAQAAAELKAAKDAGKNLKALSLCQELLTLKWTRFCKPKLTEYEADHKRFTLIASRQLLPVQLGVPEDQVRYDDAGNPTIRFTGRRWCPVQAAPDAPPQELDRLGRAFWEDWFRSQGKSEKEIEELDLVARATTQRLAWRGAVEVGPEGGYLPGKDARNGGKGWWSAPPTSPQPLLLDFPFLRDQPWSIEAEVRWPTAQPGYFAIACGQIQAVVGYFKGDFTGGGMKGACLVEADGMDPGAFARQILDLQWHVVEDEKTRRRLTEGGEKAYLDEFEEGRPCFMRLTRTRESVVFEMWPLGVPRDRQQKATVRLEKRFADPRKLDRLVTLDDGRTVFRFFGAPPGKDLPYELHDVTISGALSEKKPDVD